MKRPNQLSRASHLAAIRRKQVEERIDREKRAPHLVSSNNQKPNEDLVRDRKSSPQD